MEDIEKEFQNQKSLPAIDPVKLKEWREKFPKNADGSEKSYLEKLGLCISSDPYASLKYPTDLNKGYFEDLHKTALQIYCAFTGKGDECSPQAAWALAVLFIDSAPNFVRVRYGYSSENK